MARSYVPEAGDIAWLQFTPQAGHEQAGGSSSRRVEPGNLQWEDWAVAVLPTDLAYQRLSVRSLRRRQAPERCAGGSGQEPRLASTPRPLTLAISMQDHGGLNLES